MNQSSILISKIKSLIISDGNSEKEIIQNKGLSKNQVWDCETWWNQFLKCHNYIETTTSKEIQQKIAQNSRVLF